MKARSEARYIYAAAGFAAFLFNGWRMVFSVFFTPVMNAYGLRAVAPVAAAFTASNAASMLASPVAGRVYDRRGPLPLMLASALLQALSGLAAWLMKPLDWGAAVWLWYASVVAGGVAMALVTVSVNPLMLTLFPSRAGIALALAQSGLYASSLVWSPAAYWMLSSLGPFDTLAIFSLLSSLVTAACAAVYRGVVPRGSIAAGRGSSSRVPRLFLLLLPPLFAIAASSSILLSFTAPILEELYPPWVPGAMAAVGLAQAAGSLAWGFALERGDALKLLAALYAAEFGTALVVALLFNVDAGAALTFFLLRLAVFAGEPIVHSAAVPKLFGGEDVGRLLGLQMSAVMLAAIVAPLAGALVRDFTGSYRLVVLLSASLSLAAALALLLAIRRGLKPAEQRRGKPETAG